MSSKSRTTRCNIFQFLEQLLHVWPIHKLEGQTEAVQDALIAGLGDSDKDTRSWARKAYWAFADHFRVEADSLLSSLEQSHRQILGGDASDGSSSFPWMSSSRSRQSSVDRSQDSLDGTRVMRVLYFMHLQLVSLRLATVSHNLREVVEDPAVESIEDMVHLIMVSEIYFSYLSIIREELRNKHNELIPITVPPRPRKSPGAATAEV